MKASLTVNEDGSERVAYNTPVFPVRTVDSNLSIFHDYAAACHWHRDFEFLLVNEGSIEYFINGDIVTVNKGQSIFVNANRLHYGFSSHRQECAFSVFLFHPSLLGDQVAPIVEHLAHLSNDQNNNWLLLDESQTYGRKSLGILRSVLTLCQERLEYYELQVQGACAEMMSVLGAALRSNEGAEVDTVTDWSALRLMVGYIQTHYQEKVLLEQIACAGAVCKSKCCHLFRDHLARSPIDYLTRYRLDKANHLLALGKDSITDIALECGFNSTSYFSETYRKVFGITPRVYQERRKSESTCT